KSHWTPSCSEVSISAAQFTGGRVDEAQARDTIMPNDERAVWLAARLAPPFVGVDGPFAHRDSLALSVPVVQAMAPQVSGPIDFAVWGSVVLNLAYANLAREVWLES